MTNEPKAPAQGESRSRTVPSEGAPSRPSYGRDALGLVLLLLAFFFGVAVVMAYVDPKEQAAGMTGMVMALVQTLGVSALFLAAGLGWIGFRLWIRGVDGKVGRDLFGVVVTTFTLAMLVGALSPELGGSVGSVGALVSRQLTVFVGLVFGVMIVLLPAWFLWLRPAAIAAGEVSVSPAPAGRRASDSSGVSQAEAEGLLPKAPARPPASVSRSAAAPPAKAAAAAGPFVEDAPRREASPDHSKLSPPKVVAPSPYPPDVRREGRVPEGARPLGAGPTPFAPASPLADPPSPAWSTPEPLHEPAPAEVLRDDAAVRARAGARAVPLADRREDELRGAVQPPVVGERSGDQRAEEQPAAGRAGAAAGGHDAAAPLAASALAFGAAALAGAERDVEEELEDYPEPAAPASAVSESVATPLDRTPPAPSWEQPELFEEPVDAYGTPLSLVESLRQASGGVAPLDGEHDAEDAELTPTAPEAGEDLDDEVFVETLRPLAADSTPPGDARFEEARAAEKAAAEKAAAEKAAAEKAAAEKAAAEKAAAEKAAAEKAAAEKAAAEKAAAEKAAAEKAAAEKAAAERAAAEKAAAAEVDAREALRSELRAVIEGAGAPADEESQAEAPSAPAARQEKPVIVTRSLFAEGAPDEELASPPGPDAEPEAEAAPSPGDVVLAPARKSKRKPKAAPESATGSEPSPSVAQADHEPVERQVELTPARPRARVIVDEVVFKAGCLFVERQRVAVSMLQREFGLDFDAATQVLDQLQRAGLIGPYLGGQRRDILLTLEQWQDAVGVES